MNPNCPRCGADISQSSGVVCPACSHVLQPGVDIPPLLPGAEKTRRGRALLLSFVIPFFFVTLLCVISGGAPLVMAVICGAIVGVAFLCSWLMASRVSRSQGGQVIATILFFTGGIAIVVAVFVGGCLFLMRGMH